jgi:hypothetical protein
MAGADEITVGATAVGVAVGVAVAVAVAVADEVAVGVSVAVAEAVVVGVSVAVAVALSVAVADGVSLAVAVAVAVEVTGAVEVLVAVTVALLVGVELAVAVAVSVAVEVAVAVSVAVAVAEAVEVAVGVLVAVAVAVEVPVAVAVAVGVEVAVAVAVEVAVLVAVGVGVAVAGGRVPGPVVKRKLLPLFHSVAPLVAAILSWNTIWYLVLIERSLNGVRVALAPLQVTLTAGILPCLTTLSRNVFLFIELQFIGRLKFTVTLALTGTSMASSAGFEEITMGRGPFDAAAADPAITTITTNAAIEILLTMHLSIIVPFFVDDMKFISSFTCI